MTRPSVRVVLAPELVGQLHLREQLEHVAAETSYWSGPGDIDPASLQRAAQRSDVLVTGWGTPTLTGVLAAWDPQAMPLRLVAHTAGSVKRLLPRQALERGLLAVNAVDAIADAVAEFTIGAMIMGRRRLVQAAEQLGRGKVRTVPDEIEELLGSTVGIVGASAVGRKVMRLLAPWDTTLLLYDPYCPTSLAADLGAQRVTFDALLERSDIVSLHAPVTPETLHMLDASRLARMMDGALLVNSARGRLVDLSALLAELQSGRIAAVLDVMDPLEPLASDSPFLRLENCVVTPHVAGHSRQARARQGALIAAEVARYVEGGELRHQVRPQAWDALA